MTLYDKVVDLSKKHDLTLVELAEKLNLSRHAFYSWKTSSPKAETLKKVADYFEVSTDYLLGRTENPNFDKEDNYDDLLMMFRKSEMEVPEEKRDQYKAEITRFMEFVKEDMKNNE